MPLQKSEARWEQTKHGRVGEAMKRFYVTGGHGLGLRFFDAEAFAPEVENLTLQNVVWWVNEELAEGEELLTPQEAQFKHWHPVAPNTVYRINKPPVFRSGDFLVRNEWSDTGADITEWQTRSHEEIEQAARPITDLLRRCLQTEERFTFYVDWLRTCVQIGKPPVVPYTHGSQGQFKGVIKTSLGLALGPHSLKSVKSDADLTDMNAWEAMQSAVCVVDEVRSSSHDGSKVYNAIKGFATERRGTVRQKHAGMVERDQPAGLWLCSNHPVPFLEQGDRRFWVVTWEIEGLTDNSDPEVIAEKGRIHDELMDWLEDDGAAIWRAYLQLIPPTQKIVQAPMTPEKEQASAFGTDELAHKLADILETRFKEHQVLFTTDVVGELFPDTVRVNESRIKHLASEAGLRLTTLGECGAKGDNAELKVEDKRIVRRSNRPFYLRDGWKLSKSQGRWTVTAPDGTAKPIEWRNCVTNRHLEEHL